MPELSTYWRNEVEGIAQLIIERCPDRAAEAGKFLLAIKVGSPVIGRRFEVLIHNAIADLRDDLTRDEKQRIGEALDAMHEWTEGRSPGRPRLEDGEESVRLSLVIGSGLRDALTLYCERHGLTQSEGLRRAIELLVKDSRP